MTNTVSSHRDTLSTGKGNRRHKQLSREATAGQLKDKNGKPRKNDPRYWIGL